ncbi:hypothetical protein [Asticcacaulis sp.]|uniref:hypothetical protein n=1 Tax=Asticcacaulis sp. TaxID=1872648 RepID=UPI00262C252A|nr:hypothetical protein [Asticcacaulis sp.]
MTAAFVGRYNGCPFVISDSRITRVGSDGSHISIPVLNEPDIFVPLEYHQQIVDMENKIVFISNELVICWAGSRIEAAAVIRVLKDDDFSCSIEDFFKKISAVFTNIKNEEKIADLSIVGFFTNALCFETFKFEFKNSEFHRGGDYCIGEGGWLLDKYFSEKNKDKVLILDKKLSADQEIKNILLASIGFFFSEEKIIGTFLENVSGCSFSAAWISGGYLRVLENYSIYSFEMEVESYGYGSYHYKVDLDLVLDRMFVRDGERFRSFRFEPAGEWCYKLNLDDFESHIVNHSIHDLRRGEVAGAEHCFLEEEHCAGVVRNNAILCVFIRHNGRVVYSVELYENEHNCNPISYGEPQDGVQLIKVDETMFRNLVGYIHAPRMERFGDGITGRND